MNSFIEHIRHITSEEASSLVKILLGSILATGAGWGFLHWATGGISGENWFRLFLLGGSAAIIFCLVSGLFIFVRRPLRQEVPVRQDD